MKVWTKLYTTYVRPHLEFAVQAWSPWQRADIELLEKVQKRALNQCAELNGLSYEEKLTETKILSLEQRRTRADMIQTWKILNGVERVDERTWFTRHQNARERTTRATASPLNLLEQPSRTETRRNFFSNRVVSVWNDIPLEVREAEKLYQFKAKYDEYLMTVR